MRDAASFIAQQASSGQAGLLSAAAAAVFGYVRAWRNRRSLLRVSELDEHLLSDIGISREDVRWALDLPLGYDPAAALQERALRNRSRGWRQ